MRQIWKQQKMADLDVAQKDGDTAGNKGFVKQRVPGIASSAEELGEPAAVSPKLPLGVTQESISQSESLLEEATGLPHGEVSNKDMAERLTNLIDSSDAPATVAIPVQGLVQLLQSEVGTTATMTAGVGSTASALIKTQLRLDAELGRDQAEADDDWFKSHKSLAVETHGLLEQMQQEGTQQDRAQQEIAGLEDDMGTIRSTLHSHETSIALGASQMKQIVTGCERNYVTEWARVEGGPPRGRNGQHSEAQFPSPLSRRRG